MLKFSGCSCLTSGRKPKGVLHSAVESIAGNEGMQPAKVTYQIGTRLSGKESSSQSVNVFQLTGNPKGKPDGQIQLPFIGVHQ